jgi:hypothetical protein
MEDVFQIQCRKLDSWNKMETKYYTACTVPNSNNKIVERGKIDTSNTPIHDRSLSLLGTGKTKWLR